MPFKEVCRRTAGAFLLICLTAGAFAQKNPSVGTAYQPAIFTDGERVKKMEAVFPLIEKMYRQNAEKEHIPGFAFAIVADGKVIYSSAFGYTDLDKKTPATTKSVFRIASMTKNFAAMAILKLRDAGKLDLDDPVSKYIPEMKNIIPLTTDAPPITIRHLLTHSAGFPEDNPWGDRQLQVTDKDLINFIRGGVSLSNDPGVSYEYSNLGFALLGHLVSKISGEPYEQYINKNIFAPLGMKSSFWEYTQVAPEQLAHGYRWINNGWTEEEMLHSGAYGAMGGLMTSIEDFGKFVALHMAAWPPRDGNDNGALKRSSLREMHQPWRISGFSPQYKNPDGTLCPRISAYSYGLGWSKDCMGRESIGHSGGLPGFGSHWTFLPEYGIGVVSFSNRTYAATVGLNLQIIDTLIAAAKLQPRQLPPSALLQQRKEQLVKLLPNWNGAVTSGIFFKEFFEDYKMDSLKKEAAGIFAKAGTIIKVGELKPDNQLRGNFILEGEKADIFIRFTLSPENPGLIQEYRIREIPKK